MEKLPSITFKDVEKQQTVYAIAIYPTWEHWDPTACPLPIRVWLAEHCPKVTVNRVSGFKGMYVLEPEWACVVVNENTLPQPLFRLGFNERQAEEFERAWQNEANPSVDDFIFVVCKPARHLACLSQEELAAGIDPNDVDFSGLQSGEVPRG